MSDWVLLVYGIADRAIHAVHVRDSDSDLARVKAGPGELTLRIPRSRYQTFSSADAMAAELIP